MNLTDFQRRLSSAGQPVLVDFWAPWCGPCRMTKPVLEKMAREYAGRVTFLPVDADESRQVLEHYQVMGIPTVLAFRQGQVAARVTGAQPEAAYRALFEALASQREIVLPLSVVDRTLRLVAGSALFLAGTATGNWLILGLGGIVTFLGVYDRCPIWRALSRWVRRRFRSSA